MNKAIERFLNYNNKKILLGNNFIFAVYSILFAIIFSFAALGGDDFTVFEGSGFTIKEWAAWAGGHYHTWSSRQIINFIWAALLHMGRLPWMIYMGGSMFIALKAFEKLFSIKSSPRFSLFIIAIFSLFPFSILSTAGWIATSVTYFGPMACGFMALVPITNALGGKKESPLSLIPYSLCLVYGANQEQMMVLLLLAYTAVNVYFAVKKSFNYQALILWALAIASFVYAVTCPGNFNRDVQEQAVWFPTYGMLDFVDKAELGASTTLQWLFIDIKPFIVIAVSILTLCIWKRYKSPLFRCISLIPFVSVILIGLFNYIVPLFTSYKSKFLEPFDYYGAFTVLNPNAELSCFKFVFLLFICLCIVAEIWLLSNTIKALVIDLFLISVGFASRVMMGFSPTVYASSERTFSLLVFSIIAIVIHVFIQNEKYVFSSDKSKTALMFSEFICMIIGIVTLTLNILVAFR